MTKENYYKTKRIVIVTKSNDDRIPVGDYDVYMNEASTLGILHNEVFMPLLLAQCFDIQWEYEHGGQYWKEI